MNSQVMKVRIICVKRLNPNFECDWLIELVDNKLSNNKLSNNKLSNNNLASISW